MYTKNNPTTSIDGKTAHCPTCGSYCDINKDLDDKDYCNDCRPVNLKAVPLVDVLEKFQNGQERYDNDISFRVHVEALVHGIGVYAVLDSVLKSYKIMQDLNAKYIGENNALSMELQKHESVNGQLLTELWKRKTVSNEDTQTNPHMAPRYDAPMKAPSHNTLAPTEEEVRKHFEGQIPKDAIILRVPYTTILTLADDTLLWDCREGFAKLDNINNDKI